MPDAAPAPGRHAARLEAAQTGCALVLAVLASFRAIVGFEPFPWWSSDPFETQVFVTGLTPAHGLWLDATAIVVAAVGLAAHALGGGRLRRWLVVPGLLGTAAAAWWMVAPSNGNTIDCMRLSLAWIAAGWSAVALAHLCGDGRRRVLALALLLGLVAMLAAKGVVQVLVEHPETVAWYERDPETFLRAHGWEPGSAQARGYERRLYQPEATGWFGLSNVYATLVGASAVGLAAMAVAAVQRRQARATVALIGGAAMGVVGLWLCGSKGGAVAAAAGAALTAAVVGAAWWVMRAAKGTGRFERRPAAPEGSTEPSERWSVARWLAVGAAVVVGAAPVAAVAVRGLVGERLGELSLLFRSFYARGALRVVADHPVVGVGPAGFRDAYLLVRPPLAVEDPVSPHSVMWDCLTSFGVIGGAAWFVLALVLVAGAAHGCVRAMAGGVSGAAAEGSGLERARVADEVKLVALLAIVATAAAAMFERLLMTPETAGLRLVGVGGWVLVAWGVIAIGRTSPRALGVMALGAAATAMLHAGIEVTPTWVGAQSWFFAVLGVAGGAAVARPGAAARGGASRRARGPRGPGPTAAMIGATTGLVLALAPWSILRWQAALRDAWRAAGDVGRMQDQVRALESNPALAAELGVSPEGVRQELAALVGALPARSADELSAQMARLMTDRSQRVVEILGSAGPARDVPTRRAADRAAQRLAHLHVAADRLEAAAALLEQRADEASSFRQIGQTVVLCSHVGGLRRAQADLLDRLGRPEEAREARRAARYMYEVAVSLDPRGVHHPLRAARVAAEMDDDQMAGAWAERALENHANARLDPLMGLTEAEVVEMEGLVEAARGLAGSGG